MSKHGMHTAAEEFERFGARFDAIANNFNAKPAHLTYDFRTTTIQAASLLVRAADAGMLPKVAELRDKIERSESCLNMPRPSNDDERATWLWTNTLASWLAKEYADELRPDAKSLDWANWKATAAMELVAIYTEDELARLPPKARAALESTRLPDGRVPKRWARPDRSIVRDESKFGERDLDSEDALHRLRIRAANNADACRLLARVVLETSTAATDLINLNWLTVTEAAKAHLGDVDDIDLRRAKARVSIAADRGEFKTNGKKGRDRRIEPDSFARWRLEKREANLDSLDE